MEKNDRYEEVTAWMFDQVPMFQNVGAGAYKPGLERVEALAEAFGNPHRRFPTIHVAGTNGKGSTASLLASVLTSAGKKTGLFTSPHLVDFRERIRIDGEMITKEEVVDFIDRYRSLRGLPEPSFFELTTVMAFDHFARHGVDAAVIEVGLGGRLDSTNIITPLVSVITNISLDHTALLGDTTAQIAREKAGIIKEGVPVVIGRADESDVHAVFAAKAAEMHAPITFAAESPAFSRADRADGRIIYRGTPWGDIESPLTGDCQPENANTVFHTLGLLGDTADRKAVAAGFRDVERLSGLQGRWMTVGGHPLTICDTGHNPGGWAYLGPRLREMASEGPLEVVIGFVNDKDISHILNELPKTASYRFTQPSVRRGRPAAEVAEAAAAFGLHGETYADVAGAYRAAAEAAGADGRVFVGGSTFVVADLLNSL